MANERHDALLRQLADIAAQNKIKREAAEARDERYAADQESDYRKARSEAVDAERNPYAMSAQGASLGSAFGPWGALIGGVAGGVMGNVKDYQSRRESGEGVGSSLWGSFKDTAMPWQNKDLVRHPMNTAVRGAGALGTLGKAYGKMRADNALGGSGGMRAFDSDAPLGESGARLGISDEYRPATTDSGLQSYLSATGAGGAQPDYDQKFQLQGAGGGSGSSLGWHVDPITGKVKFG